MTSADDYPPLQKPRPDECADEVPTLDRPSTSQQQNNIDSTATPSDNTVDLSRDSVMEDADNRSQLEGEATRSVWHEDVAATKDWSIYENCEANDSPKTASASNSITRNRNAQVIGPYQLVRCLGQGGMGAVWEAQQLQPVKRRVALKLIRGGTGSPEVITRFRAERQALALMEHPSIAKILDAGISPSGQPFFAMELVDGVTLTKYCSSIKMSIDERLRLFYQICTAVHHAHQKGIIHRDLKPGNIIVTTVDGKPMPKIIDFGLAKATEGDQRLTEESMHTHAGQLLGTIKYMSPEQACLSTRDIDTRSDVYSLGVILCELLVGRTPLDDKLLGTQPLLKTLEDIREGQAVRPSMILSSLASKDSDIVALLRATDAPRLLRKVSGDLDCIVLKATENEPRHRYQSAAEFAADVERYLNLQPVLAQPPTRSYLFRKFIRKHRAAVAVASILMLSLVGGIIGTSWGLWEANLARLAESERAEGERLANLEAQSRLRQVESSNAILTGIFKELDIRQVRSGKDPLERVLADKLVEAGDILKRTEIAEPIMVAQMQTQLGESLLNLGFPREGMELLSAAADARTRLLGPSHLDTLVSRHTIGEAWLELGDFAKAMLEFEDILARRQSVLPKDDNRVLESMSNLAESYRQAGRTKEAVELLQKTVVLREAVEGSEHPDVLITVNNLGLALLAAGEAQQSKEILEVGLERAGKSLGADHPVTLAIMNNQASAYLRLDESARAIEILEKARDLIGSKMGDDHPDRLRLKHNIADIYRQTGKLEDALSLYEKSIPMLQVKLGAGHLDCLSASINYADTLGEAGRTDQAIQRYQEVIQRLMELGKQEHSYSQRALQGLAYAFWSKGQADQAIEAYEQVFSLQNRLYGDDHHETLVTMLNIGIILRESGKYEPAIERLKHVNGFVDRYSELQAARTNLQQAYSESGRLAEFVEMVEEDIAKIRQRVPAESLELAAELLWIGFRLNSVGQYSRAEAILRESYQIRYEQLGADDWKTHNTGSVLGESLMGRVFGINASSLSAVDKSVNEREISNEGRVSVDYSDEQKELLREARRLLEEGFEGLIAKQGDIPEHARQQRLLEAVDRVIVLYTQTGRAEKINVWQARKAVLLKSDKE